MCGIFGIFRAQGLSTSDRWAVRRMADALVRRGPDGEGFHVGESHAIGMTRLAIMDPAGGWQPILNEDESIAVVVNGEIYNSRELRAELESRGHSMRSQSDCEVIPHLYEEFGDECLHRLRGMFAVALVDLRRKLLLLARDRMGEKPLVLAEGGGRIAFCSELRPMVRSALVAPALDPDAILAYFHWGFVPEPMSPLVGSRKLPAGTMLKVHLDTGAREERTWWDLANSAPIDDDPAKTIRAELAEVSNITMRSDRPIAIALSGGIDSSALAVMASRSANQPLHAVSIGYRGLSLQDESGMAESLAESLGIPFTRIVVDTEDAVRRFPEVCSRRDEPIADIAGSSILALAEAARSLGAPVMLSGLGGDELFWGYRWHRECVRATLLAQRTRAQGIRSLGEYIRVRKPPVSITGAINWALDGGGAIAGIRKWIRDRNAPDGQMVFWDEIRDFAVAETVIPRIAGSHLLSARLSPKSPFRGLEPSDRPDIALTCAICATYLRSNGLGQTDRLFMSAGIEPRVPLVDHRLAETVIGLRRAHPDYGMGEKAWLRAALRGLVPDEVLARRKRGFTPPWRAWKAGMFTRFGHEIRSGALVAHGILSPQGAEFVARPFDVFRRPAPMAFQSLVLEQWLRGVLAEAGDFAQIPSEEPSLAGRRSVG
jgi:asparagine synthase (glutamine-hydrolysing)